MGEQNIQLAPCCFDELSEEPKACCDLRQGHGFYLLLQLFDHRERLLSYVFERLRIKAGEGLGCLLKQGG